MAGLNPVLFLVPARGGSKRVPGKNLRLVGGIPLVGRAVRAARRAAVDLPGGPHRVVCSTDDPQIASAARVWGAETPFERPAALASDTASSVDVAIHALDQLAETGARFRALALVQPTSPLTEPGDLRAAIECFDRAGGASVVSVTPTHPAAWHVARDAASGTLAPAAVADMGHIFSGAFYVVDPDALRAARAFVEPGRSVGAVVAAERSIDVDEELDLAAAETALSARPVRPVPVGDRVIGGGRVFLIAEAGVNHNGLVELAHRLVDAAADAGADAVKFQTFTPDGIAAPGAPTAAYQRAAVPASADQRDMLAQLALPTDAWAGLQAHARERGLVFLSSPFDDASADLLFELGVPAIKIASGELTNLPFLRRLAARGRPLLVSTGMANMVEVAAAMDAIEAAGDPPVALFHCVSSYPADVADANLRAIRTLRNAFGVPAGWSDHTPGIELPLAAVSLGAELVEKHLTLDANLPGPDHRSSLEPDAFGRMVRAIRAVELALGNGDKVPVPAERPIADVARRSLHWRHSLPAGRLVAEADLVALRPGTGLSPAAQLDLVGRRTTRHVTAGRAVERDDLEGDW